MIIVGLEVVIAALRVYDNASTHFGKWHNKGSSIWFEKLSEEVKELENVLTGDHDGTVEHELTQIAGICINWLAKIEYEHKQED